MKTIATLCFAATMSFAMVTSRGAEWDHYQIILDRHPFGALRDATNNTPDYAKNLRLSAIWLVNGLPCAGFEDSTAKRDYVLHCGESTDDGLQLLEIHYADEAVVIRKGKELAILHLQVGASTNIPPINIGQTNLTGQAGANGNPWREFFERYRQRRREERANGMGEGGPRDMRGGGEGGQPFAPGQPPPPPAMPVMTGSDSSTPR
jgi:hypothetical protein